MLIDVDLNHAITTQLSARGIAVLGAEGYRQRAMGLAIGDCPHGYREIPQDSARYLIIAVGCNVKHCCEIVAKSPVAESPVAESPVAK